MPRTHLHDKAGSVHAFRSELDAWAATRNATPSVAGPAGGTDTASDTAAVAHSQKRRAVLWSAAATAVLVVASLLVWRFLWRGGAPGNPLADARFVQLTSFGGNEHAAAVSRDGKFVAFLSNRDGRMDVWVTQVGGGQFYSMTRGSAPELVNPSVRTLGFSPDGALVTFWTRTGSSSALDIRAAPVLGGAPRPYLEGVAEFDWSLDGTRLVYHTPGPGDPTFVREPGQESRQIFAAPVGLHAHFPIWSPDARFIYFVQGGVPDRMDLWRMRPDGRAPERLTWHESAVTHPVFVDRRRVLYLATDSDGSGPWLHVMDVERRRHWRLSLGSERYTSLSASADGGILAATRANTRTTLWRMALGDGGADASAAQRLALATGSGRSPRLGPGYLVYISATDDSDSIWKLQGGESAELWRAPKARIIGAPAVARDGNRIAFCAREADRTSLYVMNADGGGARVVTGSLELHGTPAWAPDGASLTVAAVVNGAPRLFAVSLDGGSPLPLAADHANDPAWSPDGALVAYSGADIGATFPVKLHIRDGHGGRAFPELTLSRGSRRLVLMPDGRSLLMFAAASVTRISGWSTSRPAPRGSSRNSLRSSASAISMSRRTAATSWSSVRRNIPTSC